MNGSNELRKLHSDTFATQVELLSETFHKTRACILFSADTRAQSAACVHSFAMRGNKTNGASSRERLLLMSANNFSGKADGKKECVMRRIWNAKTVSGNPGRTSGNYEDDRRDRQQMFRFKGRHSS